MSTWSLTLPMLPMSMNQRERVSYWTRKRELDQTASAIQYLALEAKITPATGRREVTVTIHKSLRSRRADDPANRDSRAKAPLDALVRCGLLIDDSDEWLSWLGVVEGEKRKQVETVITIRELDA